MGDVDYEDVKGVAGWVTPVPGGVGPMTVAMLMRNTVECAKRVACKVKGWSFKYKLLGLLPLHLTERDGVLLHRS